MKGTIIKAFRGYGFIQGEDGNTYHYKPVYEVGDQVEFEPSENEKGHEAMNVRKEIKWDFTEKASPLSYDKNDHT